MTSRKTSAFAYLTQCMGKRKPLMILSIVLSALSSISGMLPFIFVWYIIRLLIFPGQVTSGYTASDYAWMAFAASVLSLLLYFFSLMSSHLAAFRVERTIRYDAMRRVMRMPAGFFSGHTIGRMRKVIDDNAGVTHSFIAHQLPDLVGGFVILLTMTVFLFIFDWRMGLLCIVPMLLSLLLFGRMMGPGYSDIMDKYMGMLEKMNTEAVEYVRGIPVVKVFQQTIYSFKRFYASIMTYSKFAKEYTVACRTPMTLYTVVSHGFAFLLIPYAVIRISMGYDWVPVIVNLVFYILITPFFAQSMMKLMHMAYGYTLASQAVDKVEALIGEGKPLSEDEVSMIPESMDIRLQGVSFSYESEGRPVLDRLDLHIPEGKKYALVGPSGGGKTTIARLIARFWDPNEGEVSIGGVPVSSIPHDVLMKHVSYVFQHTKLFKTTIRDNVTYGNEHASEEEVRKALEYARALDFVEDLPKGLDTCIGVDGTYLSGGEQQRIVLSRAFLKNAPILLLDEATAFADPENERLIRAALNHLMQDKTVLMIAHRLSSAMQMDRILVLDNGRIVEEGTHEELLSKGGVYTRMWREYEESIQWKIKKEDKK